MSLSQENNNNFPKQTHNKNTAFKNNQRFNPNTQSPQIDQQYNEDNNKKINDDYEGEEIRNENEINNSINNPILKNNYTEQGSNLVNKNYKNYNMNNDYQSNNYNICNTEPNNKTITSKLNKNNTLNETYNKNMNDNMSESSKIKELKSRISSLNNYKILAEKRILQLVPGHPLPVEDKHFSINPIAISSCSDPASKQIIVELKNQLESKENEVFSLKKEQDLLQQQLESLSKPNTERKMKFIQKEKPGYRLDFPKIEKLTQNLNSDIAVNYSTMYNSFIEVLEEKDEILKLLRAETIKNEEQKNYIEILRQTIESSIFKNGLSNMVNMQKAYYKDSGKITNVDIMIDMNKLNSESEKNRKEAVMNGVLVNELRQEVEHQQKVIEDFEVKYARLKELKDSLMYEVETHKGFSHNLEKEKSNLSLAIEDYRTGSSKLTGEVDFLMTKIRNLEKDLHEAQKKLSGTNTQLENQGELNKKNLELKQAVDSLTSELNFINKEKIGLEGQIEHLQDEILENNKEKEDNKVFIDNLKHENESYIEIKNKEIDNLNRLLRKSEKQLVEIMSSSKEKDREIKKLNDLVILNEKTVSNLKCQLQNAEKECKRLEEEAEKDCFKLEQTIKELQFSLHDSNKEGEKTSLNYERSKNDLKNKEAELKAAREEIRKLNRQSNGLSENVNALNRNLKNAETEINSLKAEEDKLNKEVRYWLDKYEKDMNEKVIEISSLIDNVSNIKIENSSLQCSLTELKNKYNMEIDEKHEIENRLAFREGQVKTLEHYEKESLRLKEEVAVAKREIDGLTKDKESYLRFNNDLKQNIDTLINEKTVIEEALRKFKQSNVCLEEDINSEKKQSRTFQEALNEAKHESYKLNENNNQLKRQITDLKLENESLIKKIREIEHHLHLTNDERSSLERDKHSLVNEVGDNDNKIKELMNKVNSYQSLHSEIKINLSSLNSILISTLSRFETGFKQASKSKNLTNFISFSYSLRPLNDNSLPDQICFMEDFVKVFSFELEQSLILNEEMIYKIEEFKDKIKSLEEENYNLVKNSEYYNKTEKDMNIRMMRSEENSKIIMNARESAEEKLRQLSTELRELKVNYNNIKEERNNYQKEVARYEQINSNLNNEIQRVVVEVDKQKEKATALENRIVLLLKEKKAFVNVISILSQSYYNGSMQLAVNDLMTLLDEMSELERERLKLEGRISITDNELKKVDSSSCNYSAVSGNSLRFSLLNEREQLSNLLRESKLAIEEKMNSIVKYENDIKQIGLNDKQKFESVSDYEMKIKRLTKELNDRNRY